MFVNIVNLLPLLIAPNEKLLRMLLPLLWIAIWERKRDIDKLLEIVVVTVGIFIVFFQ